MGMLASAFLACTLGVSALVFAAGAVPALMGYKTMVVTSGSMEPTIDTGDALVIQQAPLESLAVGDVITFQSVEGRRLVTHRIIAAKEIEGMTYFQTQGDANETPDPNLTPVDAVYGRAVQGLPRMGYLIAFTATPMGKVLLIGLPMLMLTFKEVLALLRGGKHLRERSRPSDLGQAARYEPYTPR
jgi:signal peptidase